MHRFDLSCGFKCQLVLEGISVREAVITPEITGSDAHSLDLNLFCLVMDCAL